MFYIAYGSNLSVEQMAYRCPDALLVGKAVLKDWRLAFGRHATIEPSKGDEVPVLIWKISEEDERALDRYEGFPTYYIKTTLEVIMTTLKGTHPAAVMAMVYIMTDIQKEGMPAKAYVNVIAEGYEKFGFDKSILENALKEVGYVG